MDREDIGAKCNELGTINYTYDANNNLATKVDARSITTTYAYDTLNRVKTRTYSDSTPAVSYYYDNLTNAKGKLKKVTSSVSTTEYTSFDILGRVTGHKQTTDGNDYTTAYTYNLGGAMLEETYPSTRVVKNTVDANGDLSEVTSKESSSAYFKTYVNDFTYTAAGAVSSLKLGNGKFESTAFNSRLQPTQIALGNSVGDTTSLKLDYEYGSTAAVNNGNVTKQTITVSGMSYPLVQNYTYDSLNRLESATETSNSSQTWKQEFSYDRYGNRNFVTGSDHTTTLGSCTTMCNPTFSNATNRITSSGYTFDSSGNTTADPSGRSFVYDGENKQITVSNGAGTIGQYTYDGDGKRVKKYVPSTGETTIFVYDAMGKQIAEYSTVLANSTDAKVAYLTNDNLGSPRINTDVVGAVISRHDYHPFGEEITVSTTAQRSSGFGYADDTVRKQFTGYESDSESNLDFAQARYYSHDLGRFFSIDPLMSDGADLEIPQSWNQYSYVLNRPTAFTDPDGLRWVEDQRDLGTPVWISEEDWAKISDDTKVFYKPWERMEYNSVVGRIRLDSSGDWQRIGENINENPSMPLTAGLVVVGSEGGPEMDLMIIAILAGMWHQPLPNYAPAHHHSTLLNENNAEKAAGDSQASTATTKTSLTPRGRRKLGTLAPLADETVADAIRSRGGGAGVVNSTGHWGQQTLAETANAAADGDSSAVKAIKAVKDAPRLGQRY